MDEKIRFSVIVHMEGVNREYYRSFLESLSQSIYKNYELVITDAGNTNTNGDIAEEFFPEKGRLIYRKVRPGRSRGYSLNYAISLAKGDFFLFFDGHSRISHAALLEMVKVSDSAGLIYSDNDELVGTDRMNPDFKCDANVELIRQRNYIGDIFAISREAIKTIGMFKDISYATKYELLLRAFENKIKIKHIPRLLYSKRIIRGIEESTRNKAVMEVAYREHLAVAKAHLRRLGITGDINGIRRSTHWEVEYDGKDYRNHRGEYLVVRDKNIRVRLRDAIPKLYGILKQPDVGIVGGAITRGAFSYDNCGYIFDKSGIIYPACHGQSVFYDGYNYRCILPQDVSLVDFSFCLIKKKVYKGLGGFDKNLTGKEMMLDFCIRAKRAGYRTVFEPRVKAKRRSGKENLNNPMMTELLLEKWGERIEAGDPFYNKNLPMGIDNYFLY